MVVFYVKIVIMKTRKGIKIRHKLTPEEKKAHDEWCAGTNLTIDNWKILAKAAGEQRLNTKWIKQARIRRHRELKKKYGKDFGNKY